MAASTPKKAEVLVDFAWKSGWPIRQTLALTVRLRTNLEFELSMTYDSPTFAVNPDLELFWGGLWYTIETDGARIPPAILRERTGYEAICQKENQSLHILWRQKLANGTYPKIPEDVGIPPIVVYGQQAELRLRNTESIPGG
jgi:hypothetical protein